MSSRVRLWRWRRNPLKRGSDRAEAVVVLIAALLLLIGAPLVGIATGVRLADSATRPGADWHRVPAVLVHRSPPAPAVFGVDNGHQQVRAEVRWHAANGSAHTGQALVKPDQPAGTRTSVWLDGRGVLRENPPDPVRAEVRAVIYGVAATGGAAGVVGCGWLVARVCLDRHRAAQLDREWALIGPVWRRHRA